MPFEIRAGIEFTLTRPGLDPMYMPDLERDTWRRFQRVMERDVRPMPFTDFQEAPVRVKNLVDLIDRYLDENRWIGVCLMNGLDEVLRRVDPIELPEEVSLILLEVNNSWRPGSCQLELDANPLIPIDEEVRNDTIRELLNAAPAMRSFKSITVLSVNTENPKLTTVSEEAAPEPAQYSHA